MSGRDDGKNESAEQRARDMLERMDHPDAQSLTAGDVVELANLIEYAETAMTEARAREILVDSGGPEAFDREIRRDKRPVVVCLDEAAYTADELEAIAWWMRNKAAPRLVGEITHIDTNIDHIDPDLSDPRRAPQFTEAELEAIRRQGPRGPIVLNKIKPYPMDFTLMQDRKRPVSEGILPHKIKGSDDEG